MMLPGAPGPLILGGWWASGATKRVRLRTQIEHAAAVGLLAPVDAFLRDLPEDEWFHESECAWLDEDFEPE
jgi:hypothetical protein